MQQVCVLCGFYLQGTRLVHRLPLRCSRCPQLPSLASICEVTADPPPFRPTFRLSQTLPVLKEGPPPPLMSVSSAPQVSSGPPASSAGFSIPRRHARCAPPPASPRQPRPWAATVVAQSPLQGPHCPQVPPQSLSRPPASTRHLCLKPPCLR